MAQARHYAGKWDMTDGRGKAGEIPIKAACRELQEELNITVTPEKRRLLLRKLLTGMTEQDFFCLYSCAE